MQARSGREDSRGRAATRWVGVAALLCIIALVASHWWRRGATSVPATANGPEAGGRPELHRRLPKAPLPSASGVVAGRVTAGEDGHPIDGALVCATALDPRLSTDQRTAPRCARTDAAGRYRLTGLSPTAHRIVASAPAFLPAARPADDAAPPLVPPAEGVLGGIDFVLEGGGVEVAGVVEDASGGPVEGAWVTVRGGAGPPAHAQSDADGAFVAWVAPGEGLATAIADGYAAGRDAGMVPGHRFVVTLLPASVLVGRVVDAEGRAVEGARVYARGDWNSRREPWTVTDSSGRFRIDGLRPGRYQPVAETDDGFGVAPTAEELGLAETSDEIEIRLEKAASVEGRIVLGEEERPCTDGHAVLKGASAGIQRRAAADPDGRVAIRGLPPGRYDVFASCADGIEPPGPTDSVEVAVAPVTGRTWRLEAGRSILGHVVDHAGRPVPGVRVYATPRSAAGAEGRPTSGSATTAADGGFRIRGLPPGAYDVHARTATVGTDDGPRSVAVPADRDVEGIRIELPATGSIAGRVLDGAGRPAGNIYVALAGGSVRWSTFTRTTDDGAFRFDGLAPGTYRVYPKDPWEKAFVTIGGDEDETKGATVDVVAGGTANVDLRVGDTGLSIRGRVVGPGGDPVPDALVAVSRDPEGGAVGRAWRAARSHLSSGFARPRLSDADGAFEISGLTPGRYTVYAMQRGGGEGYVEGVEAGEEVDVPIEPAGAVEGTVRTIDGRAPARYSVFVEMPGGTVVARSAFAGSSRFAIEDVPAGTYTLRVESDEGTGRAEGVEIEPGAITEDVVVPLEGRGAVTGRFVDVESDEPVAGIGTSYARSGAGFAVDMTTMSGGPHVSGPDGRFRLEGVPAGDVRLVAFGTTPDTSIGIVSIPVRVAAGRTTDLGDVPVVRRPASSSQETHGDLGFEVENADPFAPATGALRVAEVRPGGPAAAAGLEPGDEIVRVGSHDVTGRGRYLFAGLTEVPPGTQVSLGLADGRTVTVTAAPRP